MYTYEDFSEVELNEISQIDFSEGIINEFKQKVIEHLVSEEFFKRKVIKKEDFDEKYGNLINLINDNAPVKIISKNKNEIETMQIFDEIIEEIKKIDLQKRIEFLEDKVSMNLDESLYSELLSLRNQLKSG